MSDSQSNRLQIDADYILNTCSIANIVIKVGYWLMLSFINVGYFLPEVGHGKIYIAIIVHDLHVCKLILWKVRVAKYKYRYRPMTFGCEDQSLQSVGMFCFAFAGLIVQSL